MNTSESIVNNLLIELDTLTHRLRNIKQSFKTSLNSKLKERLICENKIIYERVNQIMKAGEIINRKSIEKINFSALLIEKSKRTIKEEKKETDLFLL